MGVDVSVILPTYNRVKFLKRSLDSVFLQKGASFEVIVVDDGSDDGSMEFIKLNYPDVICLWQKNKGVSSARNLGIQHAKGKWLAFIDSDDEWLDGKLNAQLQHFKANPGSQVNQTNEIWYREGQRVNQRKHQLKKSGDLFGQSLKTCAISPSTVMIHRAIIDDVGGFDEGFLVCEDYELWLRITAMYEVGLVIPAYSQRFSGHGDQLSESVEVLDLFRIHALLKLLKKDYFNKLQREQAVQMLNLKAKIYLSGAEKRGKLVEVESLNLLLKTI